MTSRIHRAGQAALLLWLSCLVATTVARGETITFEEPIPVPESVNLQYCNVGVEFLAGGQIVAPAIGTESPPNALNNDYPGNEFGYQDEIEIRFTAGQSDVSVKVGLDQAYATPQHGQAQLLAYSSTTPGVGLIGSDTVQLGNMPTPIEQTLRVLSFQSEIRSVMIRFGVGTSEAYEVIDDLTFDVAGPPCGTGDSGPPSVTIYEPDPGFVYNNPETTLRFAVSDDLRVAQVKVELFDLAAGLLGSFYRCGGGGLACPTQTSFVSEFHSSLPAGTATILVTAYDFFGNVDSAAVGVTEELPGPDYNLWAEALEITQAVQPWLPVNGMTRGTTLPTFTYPNVDFVPDSVPLIAGRTTVVRLFPNVEDTAGGAAVGQVTGSLRCYTDPGFTLPCPGFFGPVFPENRPTKSTTYVTVDPADDLDTRRRDPTRSLNFVLPRAWVDQLPTDPGGDRFAIYLEAQVIGPFSLPECAGCDDLANRIRVSFVPFRIMPGFSESLVIQVRVKRRSLIQDDSFTPPHDWVLKYINYLRKTMPVDESTINSFLPVIVADQDDEDGNVYCDNAKARALLPYNASDECCANGFRVAHSYMGGDIDGADGPDCGGGGLGASDGYAKTIVNAAPVTGSLFVPAQEIGHANGDRLGVPRGLLGHAGPPPGHGSECAGRCAVACVASGGKPDCNCNFLPDEVDISNGTSMDVDGDEVPDECQCNQNGDCPANFGPCNTSCDRDWPWPHGNIGAFGFDILNFDVIPEDRAECHTPGVCDNGIDDDNDGFVDEQCIFPGGTLTDPTNDPHDFMSYGPCTRWVSSRTWIRMYNQFTQNNLPWPTSGAAQASPTGAPTTAVSLLPARTAKPGDAKVRGAVPQALIVGGDREHDESWTLRPAFEVDFLTPGTEEGIGDYRIELRSSTGQVLAARNFDLIQLSGSLGHDDAERFDQVLPLPAGVDSIALIHDGAVEVEVFRSASAPSVNLITPDANGFAGGAPVSWTASDADGDPMHFIAQYTPGNGAPWQTLGTAGQGLTLPVEVHDLPGSDQAQVRVLASDGLNTTVVTSPSFFLAGKVPDVEILAPEDGTTLMEGERRVARGTAFDVEDGPIGDAGLLWSSDLDGALGSGAELDLECLSAGTHVITLQATDGDQQTGQASIGLTVDPRVNGQPLADAGPDQIAGTTAFLDGTASSDPEDDVLGYHWSLVSGPPGAGGTFNSPTLDTPTFTVVAPGTYELALIVDDGQLDSTEDRVVIEFCTDNDADRACADLVTEGLDCDDGDPSVYPGAPEVHDGQDQNCPGDPGYGLIDEVSGDSRLGPSVYNDVDREQFAWEYQSGAQLYQVARSDRADFSGDCTLVTTSDLHWVDSEIPPSGNAFYYMVRADWPGDGDWGADSAQQPRTLACTTTDHALVFRDKGQDDLPMPILHEIFSGIAAQSTDHLSFEIRSPFYGTPAWRLGRCMERADFYVDRYLSFAPSNGAPFSGNWNKWWFDSVVGQWSGPTTQTYSNGFGASCSGPFSWCVEQGLGGLGTMSVRPGDAGLCEVFANIKGGCSSGDWLLTIKVGSDRASACGF